MEFTFEDYKKSAEYITKKLGDFKPQILLVLGSGLGFLGDEVENPIYVDYKDIPNFKSSTAPGHKGRFVFGKLCGKDVAVMQGRLHSYEGYTLEEVVYPIRTMKLVGIKQLILTNAAGAINAQFRIGDVMLITDHIKLTIGSPLCGPNIEEFGTRFPDMTYTYTPRLQEVAKKAAKNVHVNLREGVYMFFPGPQFETPAEVRAARTLGADAAGMSTVPEAIAASHMGLETLGFTLCTNMAAGVSSVPLYGSDVDEAAAKASNYFSELIKEVVTLM